MFPKLNPKQMEKAMKRMGVQQKEIPATEVIIKTEDKDLIIKDPQVMKVNMMGQESLQITGEIQEIETKVKQEDIDTVAEQANVSKEEAQAALEKSNGDLAQAILSLKK
jgi:nascent polypeptide-associated complex subunit alpha